MPQVKLSLVIIGEHSRAKQQQEQVEEKFLSLFPHAANIFQINLSSL